MNFRILTVTSLFVRLKYLKSTERPKLTLTGNWMQKAGFPIGTKVKIIVEPNKIIITNER